MKKIFISFFLTCFAVYGHSQTQQVVASSGGTGQFNDTNIEWTLGETVIATLSSDNMLITQGFQQPELTVTVIKSDHDMPGVLEAYPNPTNDLLMIEVENKEFIDFQYVLYDMNGKVLEKKALISTVTGIAMNNHPPGVYLLKITQSDKEIKMFEIVKN